MFPSSQGTLALVESLASAARAPPRDGHPRRRRLGEARALSQLLFAADRPHAAGESHLPVAPLSGVGGLYGEVGVYRGAGRGRWRGDDVKRAGLVCLHADRYNYLHTFVRHDRASLYCNVIVQ